MLPDRARPGGGFPPDSAGLRRSTLSIAFLPHESDTDRCPPTARQALRLVQACSIGCHSTLTAISITPGRRSWRCVAGGYIEIAHKTRTILAIHRPQSATSVTTEGVLAVAACERCRPERGGWCLRDGTVTQAIEPGSRQRFGAAVGASRALPKHGVTLPESPLATASSGFGVRSGLRPPRDSLWRGAAQGRTDRLHHVSRH
jgi:hypothetical protein